MFNFKLKLQVPFQKPQQSKTPF